MNEVRRTEEPHQHTCNTLPVTIPSLREGVSREPPKKLCVLSVQIIPATQTLLAGVMSQMILCSNKDQSQMNADALFSLLRRHCKRTVMELTCS